MRRLRWGWPCAVLAVLSPALSVAASPAAGSSVTNAASLAYHDSTGAQASASNLASVTVDELLDIAGVANDAGDVTVATPQAGAALAFTLTNAGNGTETWNLAADLAIAGDQFNPANARIYLDDGDNAFGAATDTLATSVTLAAGASRKIFVVADIPAGRINADRGAITLAATSATGTGAPGDVLAAQGDGGSDAVIGASGAAVQLAGAFKVSALPPPSAASIVLYDYAPGASGTTALLADGGSYDSTGGGNFLPLPAPVTVGGAPINTGAPVGLRPSPVFHAREPVFIAVTDANRNVDPNARETLDVLVTGSGGDAETLRLLETGASTGVFVAAIQTSPSQAAVVPHDGRLTGPAGGSFVASYTDAIYPADQVQAAVLVDPFGVVFSSATGAPLSGATVTLVNAGTGLPAAVFGDDTTSTYPSTVVTGSPVTDSGGATYAYGAGQFRFPFVAPGSYRLVVTPPAGFLAPSIVAAGSQPAPPGGGTYAVGAGSYGDAFTITSGPALNIDIPVDPVVTRLALDKAVSMPEATAGDFLQYRLSLRNVDPLVTASAITLTDRLPPGLRYRPGTLRIDGTPAPDPAIGADGRTLAIPAGTLAPGAARAISYVAVVAAGLAPGVAVNTASASANAGTDLSNVAQASVRIRAPLFSGGFTVIGRVGEGACTAAWDTLKGVPKVKLLLDDGTYVTTDADGQYHFEGVRPGTHVVQLDLDSLPPGYAVQPCLRNTRTAGRSYSQFIDVRGGGLWRADFIVARRDVPVAAAASGAAPAAAPATAVSATGEVREYTLRAQFDSGRATLQPEGLAEVAKLAAALRGQDIARIEVAGHTDDQRMSAPTRRRFGDNKGLSLARARAVADALQAALQLPAGRIVATGKGADEPLASNATVEGRARNRRTEVRVTGAQAAGAAPVDRVAPERDEFAGQAPGIAWLSPEEGATRKDTTDIVIKHAPEQRVFLKYRPGEDRHPLRFEGTRLSPDGTVAISRWSEVPLVPGPNPLEAVIADAQGATVATLERTVHSTAGLPPAAAQATIVAGQSVLVADGIRTPLIAVRLVDASGAPLPSGAKGRFWLAAPYLAAARESAEQSRALAGLDRFDPLWTVEGDDGLAFIALQPTTQAGEVRLALELPGAATRADVSAWLEPDVRDWVVVGFAEGTAGYSTLKARSQPLGGAEDGAYTDGQVSLYAKGRVLGKWLLTLAYDSDKPGEAERRRSLLSTIDPDQFYTLYGDGAAQRHDASSQDKLYVKLERAQFYALFGDYDTGLTRTELSRYSRTLSGLKAQYADGPVAVTAFAAQTPLAHARDEIQGDGTSGLYRLSRGGLVLNGESVRIEVRDRLHSERILESRPLARHLDYDIDYAAGTLFFRAPVPSRDAAFNPTFIVAEYETVSAGDEALNAGGRVAAALAGGRVELGVTGVRDENAFGATGLGGADLTLRLDEASTLKLEGARTDGEQGLLSPSGGAWLAEYQRHGALFDALVYSRSQDPGFGVGQQNGAERGQQKYGAGGRLKLAERWSVAAEGWRQEDRLSDAVRQAAQGRLQYALPDGAASLGVSLVHDTSAIGQAFDSRQGTAAASHWFFDRTLELRGSAEADLGGRHESVDFPNRYVLGTSLQVTPEARLVASQEFTDGATFDSRTTRVGVEAAPWGGARLTTTLNQSQVSEYGPRSFAQLGLAQALLLGERWGLDFTADANRTLRESGSPLVLDTSHPIASGGAFGSGALTEDFDAFTAGATYRAPLWSWNGRLEARDGEIADRQGGATGFLRQAQAGVALAAGARAFQTQQAGGARGRLGSAELSLAWRPLGAAYAVLDRLEWRLDEVRHGSGLAGSALFGDNGLVANGDARVRRLVNNFALNAVSRQWTEEDRRGNLFTAVEREQWSVFYGSKYSFDQYPGVSVAGYTDLLGLEGRHDVRDWLDVGLQASALHAWAADTIEYSAGPRVGVTPVTNGWIVLGWNFTGFRDGDFDAARYSAQGPYLQLRFKFDQDTRLGPDRDDPRAPAAPAGVRP